MLDVARHFFPLPTLKAVVDRMALSKLNVLHLHLSDDQGFRLALDKHPELVRVAAFRNENGASYGGFYSKAQIRELIAYADAKGILVVPEIDLPGHTRAILAAHPELSCTGTPQPVPTTYGIFDDVLCLGNDLSLALVDDIIREVADLFPAPYIHIGGDEVPMHRWSECSKCRARMEREHLPTVGALQPWFTRLVSDMVRKRGKTPIAWDEVLTPGANLGKDTIIMAWRSAGEGQRAAAAGYRVIMTPNQFTYLNARQRGQARRPGETGEETLPLEDVLAFDPLESFPAPNLLLGGEVALWTERVTNLAEIDTQLYPRMPALADTLWFGRPLPPQNAMGRLHAQLPTWDRLGIGYYIEPPRGMFERTHFLTDALVKLEPVPLYGGRIDVSLDGGAPFPYTEPFVVRGTTQVSAVIVLPSGKRSVAAEGLFFKDTLRPARAVSNTGVRPGAWYTYYEGEFDVVPTLEGKPSLATGSNDRLDLQAALRKENYALAFRATFRVPEDGIYTFYVTADDGALLDVDGDRVVDNDGRHGPREKRGQIALAAGVHPLALRYFQRGGGATLRVEIEGPGLSRQELRAPLLLAP